MQRLMLKPGGRRLQPPCSCKCPEVVAETARRTSCLCLADGREHPPLIPDDLKTLMPNGLLPLMPDELQPLMPAELQPLRPDELHPRPQARSTLF